ncbi:N-6 DNA methylase [Bacillus sp. FSL R5-0820]|uniref:Eco57I restriction-modification methylase domain-containing protein n=1 Tax=Bacillus sp. FSL R5-0820 TaxID=2954560 RepID=UPI003159E9FA
MSKQIDVSPWFEANKEQKQQLLGQVYTPINIADVMTEIAMSLKPNKILDPCFGKGIFIDSLLKKGYPKENIIGVEIDPFCYNDYKESNVSLDLENINFFNFNKQVDCVIMNPPYVRQENLTTDMPDFLNKNYLNEKLKSLRVELSARSNLYLYFFVKAWSILKDNGSIIAIVPNTWAIADYGTKFKEFLLDNFLIEKFISFDKDVFPDADVESCILQLTKKGREEKYPNHKMEFVDISNKINGSFKNIFMENKESNFNQYYQKDLKVKSNWITIFKNENEWDESSLVSLDSLTVINRGIGTNGNSIFIDEASKFKDMFNQFFQPIVCSPKDVTGYTTGSRIKEDFILMTDANKEELPKELLDFLEEQEIKLANNKKPKTLYEKFKKNPDSWYQIKRTQPSTIIFSYIIRENKKFIFNESRLIARDNFYEINVKEGVDPFLLFSILNSNITSYYLEGIGRTHGKGLLKVQKYELDQLKVINPATISSEDKKTLIALAKRLIAENDNSLIGTIDTILLPYLSEGLKIEQLLHLLKQKEQERSAKKKV